MIVKEYYKTRKDGVKLYRTYSDNGCNLLQNETGVEYSVAVDVEGAPYTYTEVENKEELTAEEALDIIVGGET